MYGLIKEQKNEHADFLYSISIRVCLLGFFLGGGGGFGFFYFFFFRLMRALHHTNLYKASKVFGIKHTSSYKCVNIVSCVKHMMPENNKL